jgi:hypothetical protein
VKDRWVYELKKDDRRDEILRVKVNQKAIRMMEEMQA